MYIPTQFNYIEKLKSKSLRTDTPIRVSNSNKTRILSYKIIKTNLKHDNLTIKHPGCYILPPLNWISSSKFGLSQGKKNNTKPENSSASHKIYDITPQTKMPEAYRPCPVLCPVSLHSTLRWLVPTQKFSHATQSGWCLQVYTSYWDDMLRPKSRDAMSTPIIRLKTNYKYKNTFSIFQNLITDEKLKRNSSADIGLDLPLIHPNS